MVVGNAVGCGTKEQIQDLLCTSSSAGELCATLVELVGHPLMDSVTSAAVEAVRSAYARAEELQDPSLRAGLEAAGVLPALNLRVELGDEAAWALLERYVDLVEQKQQQQDHA